MRELPEDTLYDQRLIKRHIEEGLITEDDVKKYLENLEDAEHNLAYVEVVATGQPVPEAPLSPVAPVDAV